MSSHVNRMPFRTEASMLDTYVFGLSIRSNIDYDWLMTVVTFFSALLNVLPCDIMEISTQTPSSRCYSLSCKCFAALSQVKEPKHVSTRITRLHRQLGQKPVSKAIAQCGKGLFEVDCSFGYLVSIRQVPCLPECRGRLTNR